MSLRVVCCVISFCCAFFSSYAILSQDCQEKKAGLALFFSSRPRLAQEDSPMPSIARNIIARIRRRAPAIHSPFGNNGFAWGSPQPTRPQRIQTSLASLSQLQRVCSAVWIDTPECAQFRQFLSIGVFGRGLAPRFSDDSLPDAVSASIRSSWLRHSRNAPFSSSGKTLQATLRGVLESLYSDGDCVLAPYTDDNGQPRAVVHTSPQILLVYTQDGESVTIAGVKVSRTSGQPLAYMLAGSQGQAVSVSAGSVVRVSLDDTLYAYRSVPRIASLAYLSQAGQASTSAIANNLQSIGLLLGVQTSNFAAGSSPVSADSEFTTSILRR